ENKLFPSAINHIQTGPTEPNRIYVGTVADGFHFCQYRMETPSAPPLSGSTTPLLPVRKIDIIAVSVSNKYMSTSTLIDSETMSGGDKFGTLFISRLSKETAEFIKNDPTGGFRVGKMGEIIRK